MVVARPSRPSSDRPEVSARSALAPAERLHHRHRMRLVLAQQAHHVGVGDDPAQPGPLLNCCSR